MSIPTTEAIFGTIELQNNSYELLSQPLSDEQFEKINQYKKDNNYGVSSAPWSINKYKWIVENDKLYLVDIRFKLCDNKSNHIQNIFNTDKFFAFWVNRELKLLVSNKDINEVDAERKIILLNIENGIIKSIANQKEQYLIPKIRKYLDS